MKTRVFVSITLGLAAIFMTFMYCAWKVDRAKAEEERRRFMYCHQVESLHEEWCRTMVKDILKVYDPSLARSVVPDRFTSEAAKLRFSERKMIIWDVSKFVPGSPAPTTTAPEDQGGWWQWRESLVRAFGEMSSATDFLSKRSRLSIDWDQVAAMYSNHVSIAESVDTQTTARNVVIALLNKQGGSIAQYEGGHLHASQGALLWIYLWPECELVYLTACQASNPRAISSVTPSISEVEPVVGDVLSHLQAQARRER